MKRRGFLGALGFAPLLPAAAVAAANLEQEKPKFKPVEWAECPDCQATMRVFEGEEPVCGYCNEHEAMNTGRRSTTFGGAGILIGTDPDKARFDATFGGGVAIGRAAEAGPGPMETQFPPKLKYHDQTVDGFVHSSSDFDPLEIGPSSVVWHGDTSYETDENGVLTTRKIDDILNGD